MNDEAKELLIESAGKLQEYLDSTEVFVLEQAPLLAQEVVRYGVWVNGSFSIGSAFLSILVLGIWVLYARSRVKNDDWDTNPEIFISAMLSMFIFVPSIVCFSVTVGSFLKALIAPRLYLLETIGSLLG